VSLDLMDSGSNAMQDLGVQTFHKYTESDYPYNSREGILEVINSHA